MMALACQHGTDEDAVDFRVGDDVMIAVESIIELLWEMYTALFVMGLITTITEWDHIHTSTVKKVLYVFTFPLFMFTYIPISFVSLFTNPGWKPICHSSSFVPEDIRADAGLNSLPK